MAIQAFVQLDRPASRVAPVVGVLAVVLAVALGSAHYMESNGHYVTGMTNRVVWGLPHVFAIFMIVAASGALNVASIASVFGVADYKKLAPLSALLAMALLAGGLSVLVLDLGRPDRLTVAMTMLNPRSIFAWNIFLYTGFLVIAAGYLATMIYKRWNPFSGRVGLLAFVWRLVLTSGTGSIFGFLVARQAFHSAMMPPLFIALSLDFGLAVFVVVAAMLRIGPPPRVNRLLMVFVAAQGLLVTLLHLTNLYAPGGRALEQFLLVDGGPYPALFWFGQVGVATVLPLLLAWRGQTLIAAVSVIVGGFAQIYLILIGGQAFPQSILPGFVLHSSYGDGSMATYLPSLPELLLGLGGIAIAALILLFGTMIFRLLPAKAAS